MFCCQVESAEHPPAAYSDCVSRAPRTGLLRRVLCQASCQPQRQHSRLFSLRHYVIRSAAARQRTLSVQHVWEQDDLRRTGLVHVLYARYTSRLVRVMHLLWQPTLINYYM